MFLVILFILKLKWWCSTKNIKWFYLWTNKYTI